MTERISDQVGQRLRKLRVARGFSVRELARRSGLPPESISRAERGLTEMTITSLAKACDALGVDLPRFFAFAKKAPGPELPTAHARRAVELLAQQPPERAARAVRALALMLGETRDEYGAEAEQVPIAAEKGSGYGARPRGKKHRAT